MIGYIYALPLFLKIVIQQKAQNLGYFSATIHGLKASPNYIEIKELNLTKDSKNIIIKDVTILLDLLSTSIVTAIKISDAQVPITAFSNNKAAQRSFALPILPPIEINRLKVYGDVNNQILLSNIQIQPKAQRSYKISATAQATYSGLELYADIKGNFKDLDDYTTTLTLHKLSGIFKGLVDFKRTSGWVNIAKTPQKLRPLLSSEITFGSIRPLLADVSLKSVTLNLQSTSDESYTVTLEGANTQHKLHTALYANIALKHKGWDIDGNLDINKINAPLQKAQIKSNFSWHMPEAKDIFAPSQWHGGIGANAVFKNFTYQNITNINTALTGTYTFQTQRFTIESQGISAQLNPAQNVAATELSGTFDAKGQLSKGAKSIHIRLKDGALTHQDISLHGINTVFVVLPYPTLTIPKKDIFVAAANLGGLPLYNGNIKLSYTHHQSPQIPIHFMEWNFANGKVSVDPFTVALDPFSLGTLNVKAHKLDLSKLFELVSLDGLHADGVISGHFPVQVQNGDVIIKNALLSSTNNGSIRYNPEQIPSFLQADNANIENLRTALKNYQYNVLSMTLTGESGKKQNIQLKAKGSNPDFYDGHPVNLNLNLEGALDNLLKFNLETYKIPDKIEKRLKAFEDKLK